MSFGNRALPWLAPCCLLIIASVGILASVLRVTLVLQGQPPDGAAPLDWVDQRYVDHAISSLLHVVPGAVFLLIGPFQFLPAIRRRWPNLHRWMGRVFIVSGLASALSILWMVIVFPAMGGAATITASYFYAGFLMLALAKAYTAIRGRDVARHRAWMIRAYAIGIAVASIRVIAILADLMLGMDFVDDFGLFVWAGFTLNLAIAEIVVWLTGARGKPATS